MNLILLFLYEPEYVQRGLRLFYKLGIWFGIVGFGFWYVFAEVKSKWPTKTIVDPFLGERVVNKKYKMQVLVRVVGFTLSLLIPLWGLWQGLGVLGMYDAQAQMDSDEAEPRKSSN